MNLDTIARTYLQKIRPKAMEEIDWFRNQATLTAAIETAALARNSRGKRYSRQRRLKRTTLETARDVLMMHSRGISHCGNFHEFFVLIERGSSSLHCQRLTRHADKELFERPF